MIKIDGEKFIETRHHLGEVFYQSFVDRLILVFTVSYKSLRAYNILKCIATCFVVLYSVFMNVLLQMI